MKKKSIIAAALVAVLAVVGVLVHRQAFAKETTTYRFTTVERGDLESTVSSTGTLSAVTTVQVGTQVSGQISDLLVDFNDTVKKGQLLARIDPTLQEQTVADAAASLERARAQYLQARREANRSGELMSAGLVARSEFESADSSLDVARANVKSAQVALDRAKRNLEYTNIHAPIDGVVVERNVDHGQTVAASLSAPQLFLIANDLTNMQILASVGESDIARIKDGQKVKFTVQALPRQTFEGTVQQVRLQSVTNENVVNYTVVVSVSNPEKKLLPGMTARVEFLTESAEDVLKVANAALRFKPDPAVILSREDGEGPRAASRGRAGTRAARTAGGPSASTRLRMTGGTLYVVDAQGAMQAIRIRTGITDGKVTEVRGRELKEGMKVIAGTAQPQSAETDTANPFQQNNSNQQRGPRPGGF
ncbi:MAG TPA: efflux RND transporter periplasmic adaptor subunit [Thermoanaerobaculia bacterium]|jgi:HlyD family secretion protein|nr:efflux RND transporter periplasmic adaptor subunit [Thermoanaerobaculia bacterium]